VEAIAMAGSRASEFADAESDADLYVYLTEDIRLDERTRIAAGSPRVEIGNTTWEPDDEWIDPASGTPVDVMLRQVAFWWGTWHRRDTRRVSGTTGFILRLCLNATVGLRRCRNERL
jgi:hypothetical protein